MSNMLVHVSVNECVHLFEIQIAVFEPLLWGLRDVHKHDC